MPLNLEPPADFVDPRLQPGFLPEYWPLWNGQAGPPIGSQELYDCRCLEFLAAFYELNVLNSRLLTARKHSATGPEAQTLLLAIDVATQRLEKLEDRYAPIGFYGEPVMDGMLYRSVVFVRPKVPNIYGPKKGASSHVAIPGLENIPASELKGKVTVRRWGHGKMDL
jgi:hypothetical protein